MVKVITCTVDSILLGDFNVKVGHGSVEDCVGSYGLCERSKIGKKLIAFSKIRNLLIKTWYKLPKRKLYTLTIPNPHNRQDNKEPDSLYFNRRKI